MNEIIKNIQKMNFVEIKDIILKECIQPKTIAEVNEKREIPITTIRYMIERKELGKGLLYDGLIEVASKDGKANKYKTTDKGLTYLTKLVEIEQDKIKQQEMIEMEGMDVQKKIDKLQEFFRGYNISTGQKTLSIDFNELSIFSPELAESLLDDTEETFKMAEAAVEQLCIEETHNFKVRFKNLPRSRNIPIREIRSKNLMQFYQIEGVVRQKGDVRPQTTSAKFECPACGNVMNVLQLDTTFKEPTQCGCGRKGKFRLVSKELIDAQGLVLEEEPTELEAGQQPKRISVFLRDDLVSPISDKKTEVGSKIRVTGIIKEVPIFLRSGGKSTRFDLLFEANHVEQLDEEISSLELGEEDKRQIIELSARPDVYELLWNSLVPNIKGHEKIKEGCLLQQMGGVRKSYGGTSLRGDIHIIMIGDPASGKSQITKRISKVAPKAQFVSTGSSGVGLTASVVKDELFKGGFSLEAGAFVLANNGGMCIDEMDKIDEKQLDELHTPMEQQIVVINKANIHATLKSEAWVLANANPKFGRFDISGVLADQITFPLTLLNRFDLIYIIKDIPEEQKDTAMAQFILNMHRGKKNEQVELISDELLRKYILYARKNIHPQLTDEANDAIKNYYCKLRSIDKNELIKNIPLNPRQIEGLIRLSEASAKTRLSEEVTKIDTDRAISLLQFTLETVGVDPNTGKIDIDRIQTGISASSRDLYGRLLKIVKDLENTYGKAIPTEEIVKQADAHGFNEQDVEAAISKLLMKGELMEPRNGFIGRVP